MVLGVIANSFRGRQSSHGSLGEGHARLNGNARTHRNENGSGVGTSNGISNDNNGSGFTGGTPLANRHLSSFSSQGSSSDGKGSSGSAATAGPTTLWGKLRSGRRASSAASSKQPPTLEALTNRGKSKRHVVRWATEQRNRSPTPPALAFDEKVQTATIIRRPSSSLEAARNGDGEFNGFSLADLVSGGCTDLMTHNVEDEEDAVQTQFATISARSSPATTPWLYPEGDALEDHDDARSVTSSMIEAEASFKAEGFAMHSVCFVVKNIERSLEFYLHFLGMDLVHTIDNEDHKMYFVGYHPAVTTPSHSGPRSRDSTGNLHAHHPGDAASVHSSHSTIFGRRSGIVQLISVPGSEDDPSFVIKHAESRGYNHMTLTVPNVRRALRRLKALGTDIVDDGTENPGFAVVQDPDGYNIMLMSRDEGHDAWIRNQIRSAMATHKAKRASTHIIEPLLLDEQQQQQGLPQQRADRTASTAGPLPAPASDTLADLSSIVHSTNGYASTPHQTMHSSSLLSAPASGATVITTSDLADCTRDDEQLRLIERARTAKGGTPASFAD